MPPPDKWKREEIIREMIRHEDTLRDDRLSYLLTLNGFLFAALAFAWVTDDGESIPLVCLLAVVGLVAGLSAYAGQNISNLAVEKLREEAQHPDLRVTGLTSDEAGEWNDRFAPWNVLPKLLIVIWPAIAVARILTAFVSWIVP